MEKDKIWLKKKEKTHNNDWSYCIFKETIGVHSGWDKTLPQGKVAQLKKMTTQWEKNMGKLGLQCNTFEPHLQESAPEESNHEHWGDLASVLWSLCSFFDPTDCIAWLQNVSPKSDASTKGKDHHAWTILLFRLCLLQKKYTKKIINEEDLLIAWIKIPKHILLFFTWSKADGILHPKGSLEEKRSDLELLCTVRQANIPNSLCFVFSNSAQTQN